MNDKTIIQNNIIIDSFDKQIPFDSKTKEIINQEKEECNYLIKIFKENM